MEYIIVIVIFFIIACLSDSRTANQPAPVPVPTAAQPVNNQETGPMVYFANDRHGRTDREYRFNYKYVGDSWRAYILRMPDLCGRNAGGGITHRLYDNGQHYICWNTRVATLKEMQTISRVWADSIQEYIATGTRFGPQ